MKPLIVGEDVCVEFPIYYDSQRSFKKAVIKATTGGHIGRDASNHKIVKALDGLDFRFEEGDRVGLMGHNGCGKTTLLRVLTGIYEPVRGTLDLRGRVAALLDVSMGLDPEATGYENIYLRGIMSGMKPAQIRSHIDDIAEFSDLGDYLTMPIRTYSSGMMVRLAFSISTSIEADILLMDEWLSVGDSEFSAKASERLNGLINRAGILVIASHNPDLIQKVCNRLIRMEHGVIVEDRVLGTENVDDSQGEGAVAC